jgi:hypothetical protein
MLYHRALTESSDRNADGTKVEVKSSGYLQSWNQRSLSQITFRGLTGFTWDDKKGWGDQREVRADVFVFAIQTCRDPDVYDFLDLGQWEFWIVAGDDVRRYGTRSVGMGFLREHAPEPVAYDELAATVRAIGRGKPRA